MKKLSLFFWLLLVLLLIVLVVNLFVLQGKKNDHIAFGVNFSEAHMQFLGLDWKKGYLDMLEDLGVKHIKILTNWDFLESQNGVFNFQDTDWQIQEAGNHGADVIYVIGMKTGRWPECHVPDFVLNLSKDQQQQVLLSYIKETILRYKDEKSIIAWQAENEPLFNFGLCPWYDTNFLKKEVQLIKSLDNSRPVIVSDSGEQSSWWKAAGIGDVVGTTLYRKVWLHITDHFGFYVTMPFSPNIYHVKAEVIGLLFHKKVINVELQAEPWFPNVFTGLPLDQQKKLFSTQEFDSYVDYAERTGFDTFYFWGAEWWDWMKEKNNSPEIWNDAKKYFK